MILLLLACTDYAVVKPPPEDVALPPPQDPDAVFGNSPDWSTCPTAWYGQYYNWPDTAPDIDPLPDTPVDPEVVDWWPVGEANFTHGDASLDFGGSWYPLDEGLEGDPDYFSVRWTAWIRVMDAGSITFVLGAHTDLFLLVNKELVLSRVDTESLETETVAIDLPAGQFPIDLRFAHRRAGEAGLRFRLADEAAMICYPAFE